MKVDDLAKLLDSIANLAGVLIWPAAVAAAFYFFGAQLKDFLTSLSELSLKMAGAEISLKRKAEAAAALGAAIAQQPDEHPEAVAQQTRLAGRIVDSVSARSVREAGKTTILWVDDAPSNNVNERRALEALGIKIVLSRSTEDALNQVERQTFNLIISDLGRPGDTTAGLTLLHKLRAAGNKVPYIIYASRRALSLRDEAIGKGALAVINRPNDLFEAVVSAIEQKIE